MSARSFRLLPVLALVLGLLPGVSAHAGSYTDFELIAGPMGSEETKGWSWLAANSETVILPDDTSTVATLMNGSWTTAAWELTWDSIVFDPDPFVSFVGGFTNLFAAPMNFTLTTAIPVAPLPSTVIGGGTTVTVLDANFDGVGTLANIAGLPGYSGTIDGANALNLLFPFSITVPFVGGNNSTAQTAGLPGPTIPNGPVAATVGITHRFNLTGNDTATFNSNFIVEAAAPEPGLGLLLGLGLAGLALRRGRIGR